MTEKETEESANPRLTEDQKRNLDLEVVEGIKATKEIIGPLNKIKLNSAGQKIGGGHRSAADPNWPTEPTDAAPGSLKEALYEYADNYVLKRRSEAESKKIFNKLAERATGEQHLKPGQVAQELAKITNKSQEYISSLLDAKYKDPVKVRAGKQKADPLKSILTDELYRWLEKYSRSTQQHPYDVLKAALEWYERDHPVVIEDEN